MAGLKSGWDTGLFLKEFTGSCGAEITLVGFSGHGFSSGVFYQNNISISLAHIHYPELQTLGQRQGHTSRKIYCKFCLWKARKSLMYSAAQGSLCQVFAECKHGEFFFLWGRWHHYFCPVFCFETGKGLGSWLTDLMSFSKGARGIYMDWDSGKSHDFRSGLWWTSDWHNNSVTFGLGAKFQE